MRVPARLSIARSPYRARIYMWCVGIGCFALTGLSGCQAPSATESAPVPERKATQNEATPSAYVLKDVSAPTPAFISNGIFGVRVGRDGSGSAVDGDMPFFSRRHVARSGEEKIIPQSNPFGGTFRVGATELSPSSGSDYQQTFEFRTLILRTEWKQVIDGSAVRVRRELSARAEVLHEHVHVETERVEAVEVKFRHESARIQGSASYGTGYPFQLETNGDSNLPPNLYVSLEARGADQSGAGRNGTGFAESAALAKKGSPAHFERIVAASENFQTRELPGQAFDIEIDGPVEDQAAIRAMIAALRMAAPRDEAASIPPMGLSSDLYGGHIFWDADIWMQPVIALMDPESARHMGEYRLNRFAQAQTNYAEWVKAGRPTGTQPVQGGTAKPGGAKYPWESSVTGRETVPGPSKFEDHITGSVAWGLTQLEWLGILPAVRVAPVRAAAATFYMARSVPGPNGREIQGTMSPDEHHTGDNDLYTNLLAQWLTGESFKLPKDGTSFLTYDGDRLAGYKQAAAVLAVYPLQHPAAEKQAAAMLKRFAPKVTKNGPAMTDSVHAVIAARSGDAETAYGYWQDAWRPFTGHALGLFSEKRTSDRTVFMTGAGGGLQAVLYGFAGMRIDPPKSAVPRSGFQVKLKSGATMSVRPQLPKTWLSMNIRNATVDGVRRRITITPNLISVRPELP